MKYFYFEQKLFQIGARLFQIGAALIISNWSRCYFKSGRLCYFKTGQIYYKLGQVFQIGADLFQTGAVISNRGNYFKSVQNSVVNVVTRLIIFLLIMTYHVVKKRKKNYLDHDMVKVVEDVDVVEK